MRFRGDDARLDREIEALEAIAQLRVRRAAKEVRELERDLRELKAERARRRARIDGESLADVTASATASE
jgi:hypothetical protein